MEVMAEMASGFLWPKGSNKIDVDEKMKFIFLSTILCQSLKEVNNYDRTQTNASNISQSASD